MQFSLICKSITFVLFSTFLLFSMFDAILILDFGSQYTHLIARRIREFGVYCELFACNATVDYAKYKGIILSGSPYSVYEPGSPHVDPVIYSLNIPILGICYGLQELSFHFGGLVQSCDKKEYGHADIQFSPNLLFDGIPGNSFSV